MKVAVIIHAYDDAAAVWIMLEVIKHPVNLIKIAFVVFMLNGKLITVSLANGAALISPTIPDSTVKVINIVRLFLPYPENFINTVFKDSWSKCDYGEFL